METHTFKSKEGHVLYQYIKPRKHLNKLIKWAFSYLVKLKKQYVVYSHLDRCTWPAGCLSSTKRGKIHHIDKLHFNTHITVIVHQNKFLQVYFHLENDNKNIKNICSDMYPCTRTQLPLLDLHTRLTGSYLFHCRWYPGTLCLFYCHLLPLLSSISSSDLAG